MLTDWVYKEFTHTRTHAHHHYVGMDTVEIVQLTKWEKREAKRVRGKLNEDEKEEAQQKSTLETNSNPNGKYKI